MTLSMTCEQFETILPDLLDDDTAGAAMTPAVRAHVERCAECRALLDDLTSIRSTAATLPSLTPSRDLWAGIAERIQTPVVPLLDGAPIRRHRRQISWRSAGVAAAAIIVANLAVSYALVRRGAPASEPAATTVVNIPEPAVPSPSMMRTSMRSMPMLLPIPVPAHTTPTRRSTIVLATNGAGDEQVDEQQQQPTRRREAAKLVYDREIARLRAIVDSGRARLDPATVAILERNLRVIDTAIEQCNEALAKDSSSTFLIESLNNAYQTKVKLLRIAAAAASRG